MGSMYWYILTYRLIDGIIYIFWTISFTISLKIMSRVGAQCNENFKNVKKGENRG